MRVCSDMQKSLERDYAMMFSVTLMCCEYRDVSLLTRVQSSQWDMTLCESEFTGSKNSLYIQPSALELAMNVNMCEH